MKSVITLFTIFLFISCSNSLEADSEPDLINYDAQNEQEILEYLNAHNLTAQKSNSGLYYIIDNEGSGTRPTSNARVTVAYKGYYIDNSIFQESPIIGVSFNLNQLIKGFREGLTYFKEGGSGKLLIPSRLGYGNKQAASVPAGSVLIFDITLIRVN